jgi:proteasome component ECM29
VQKQLSQIQLGFSIALTEADVFTEECAAKGMALVYELGDARYVSHFACAYYCLIACHSSLLYSTKEELIGSLVRTFSVGRREVNQETRITLNEDKAEFATYKELCSVAMDMGQPDLVYKFLDLAAHHRSI